MPSVARKILGLLSPRERARGALLLGLMIVTALMEVIGVASVMPFLAVLGNPKIVTTNAVLHRFLIGTGLHSVHSFLFLLGVIAFVTVVFSSLVKAANQYASARFSNMRGHTIALRLLRVYLRQPYAFFLGRNSAELSKTILSEVDHVVVGVITPAVQILASGIALIALITLLMIANFQLALIVGGVLGLAYAGIYWKVRNLLLRVGVDRVKANEERFTAASEAVGGIKDIKVLGCEAAYIQRFGGPSLRFACHRATNVVLSQVPRYAIEAIGFGGMIVLILFLMRMRNDLGAVLPLIGLYAFATFRLLPAAQLVYQGFSNLRFGIPALNRICDDMRLRERALSSEDANLAPLPLTRQILFENVSFQYPGAKRTSISSLDISIPVNSMIGLVGSTGAGKTTAVDLLLGLLEPTNGRILVDETELTEVNLARWQRNLGYVPQQVYLADASISENIAFGIDSGKIDFAAVENAARAAQIHSFVENELPKGYRTLVGERGIRLSGGQRQRIGIARALYHDPAVLVMDEATSALDSETEDAVMHAICELGGLKTIVIIAHRLMYCFPL